MSLWLEEFQLVFFSTYSSVDNFGCLLVCVEAGKSDRPCLIRIGGFGLNPQEERSGAVCFTHYPSEDAERAK